MLKKLKYLLPIPFLNIKRCNNIDSTANFLKGRFMKTQGAGKLKFYSKYCFIYTVLLLFCLY